ncbi:putative sulfatase [Algisphaera agarilytica]|uniref:Putative sulfatase n=2 Tax=Algisphaera agarilytica TaxID=1385975 RepID=A0A7X0LL86_9BACT|nr:putative sulfatase [Algisphaera agarilytica]
MSDDHCARAIGAYQGRLAPLNPTPTLDALAAEGMRFDRVFCTNSICTPSRATILTGQYSHTNGVYDLYDVLPGEQHTLPRDMRAAGYTTAVIGKWHLKSSPNHFDYFGVIAGQGRYMNPTLHVSEGGELRTIRYDSTLSREVAVVDTQGHSSDVLTDLSLEWLDQKRDKTKPFFLMHHFKAPHDKFIYAPRYEPYLGDTHIPEPDNLYDQPGPNFGSVATRGVDDELVGVIGSTVSPSPTKRNLARHYRKQIEEDLGRTDLTDAEMTRETHQRYVREYLRCVKGIDDNLKRLLDYLEDNGLADNTIVIYTSDQGMLLGEHDFIDKRWMYEESIRMPLIVRWPGVVQPGSTNDWLINNTDYAVTLLDIAGIAKPQKMQGRSFADALENKPKPDDWRTGTYYRYWMHMAHGHNNPAHFGIRTERYKLIFFYGMDYTDTHNGKQVEGREGNRYWANTPAAWEFYDLLNDPHEMDNRYDDPAYREVIHELKAQLKTERQAIGDTDAENPRIKAIITEHWDR